MSKKPEGQVFVTQSGNKELLAKATDIKLPKASLSMDFTQNTPMKQSLAAMLGKSVVSFDMAADGFSKFAKAVNPPLWVDDEMSSVSLGDVLAWAQENKPKQPEKSGFELKHIKASVQYELDHIDDLLEAAKPVADEMGPPEFVTVTRNQLALMLSSYSGAKTGLVYMEPPGLLPDLPDGLYLLYSTPSHAMHVCEAGSHLEEKVNGIWVDAFDPESVTVFAYMKLPEWAK